MCCFVQDIYLSESGIVLFVTLKASLKTCQRKESSALQQRRSEMANVVLNMPRGSRGDGANASEDRRRRICHRAEVSEDEFSQGRACKSIRQEKLRETGAVDIERKEES